MAITVSDIFGYHLDPRSFRSSKRIVDNNVFVGLELELESLPYQFNNLLSDLVDTGYWNVDDDFSLRNHGRELVMGFNGEPLKGMDIVKALYFFKKFLRKLKEEFDVVPSTSERTSTHVHIDVRDLEEEELKHFMFLYIVFEETFFKLFDKSRENNNYCRKLSTNYDYIERLGCYFGNEFNLPRLTEEGFKYDGMNFLAIRTFGSLEFRIMEGSIDTRKILKWINLLLRLRLFAKNNDIDFLFYPEEISKRGLSTFIKSVFNEDAEFILNITTEAGLLKQLRVAQKCMRLSSEIKAKRRDFLVHNDIFTPSYKGGTFPAFDKLNTDLEK